jgi:murein L,D-transpeptidase YcbB/YkuD
MRAFLVSFLLLALTVPAAADVASDAVPYIEAMMTTLERGQSLDLDGEQVVVHRIIRNFYADLGNTPAWTNPAAVKQLLAALDDIRDDGLDPDDYHGPFLKAVGVETPTSARTLAVRDVLLTDALNLMLYHLIFGKADPSRLDDDWNINDLHAELDPTSTQVRAVANAEFFEAISSGALGPLFSRARPDLALYLGLREFYAGHRKIAEDGGWPEVPGGPTLREGDTDPRVAALRRRLVYSKDYTGENLDDPRFDKELEAAVIRFQIRHGLDDDGAVGKGTVAALNVPAAVRADQIRLNLERARWVMHHDLGGSLVLVNIAAYRVWLIRDYDFLWGARVQVGKPFTRTPVFTDNMTYLEFNPTWTVPVSIANRSILPKVKVDPGYLASQDMVLLDGKGNEVSPDTVDWPHVTKMPYTVRQQPGTKNALGQVKFMFPNKHAVYLHDTPSRHNFGRSARAFSSGCIRVENPLELAALLLDDQPRWDPEKIGKVIESGQRTSVRLSEPLPVLLLYWTAFMSIDGNIHFRDDLYGRDAAVLQALDARPVPHTRHVR